MAPPGTRRTPPARRTPRTRLLAAAATTASSALVLLLLAFLAEASTSCSTRGAPPNAPDEVAIAPMLYAAAVAPPPSATRAGDKNRCDARVNAGKIRTGASCQLDEQLSQGTLTLRYPCNGDGPAELTVGEHVYSGSLLQGRLSLELTTELDWDDACHWETHQTITGMLRAGTLRWAYAEKPVRGQNCFAACTASAELKIVQGAATKDDPDDDDEP